jgi:hypothetical protein
MIIAKFVWKAGKAAAFLAHSGKSVAIALDGFLSRAMSWKWLNAEAKLKLTTIRSKLVAWIASTKQGARLKDVASKMTPGIDGETANVVGHAAAYTNDVVVKAAANAGVSSQAASEVVATTMLAKASDTCTALGTDLVTVVSTAESTKALGWTSSNWATFLSLSKDRAWVAKLGKLLGMAGLMGAAAYALMEDDDEINGKIDSDGVSGSSGGSNFMGTLETGDIRKAEEVMERVHNVCKELRIQPMSLVNLLQIMEMPREVLQEALVVLTSRKRS